MRYSISLTAGEVKKHYLRGKCIVVWDTGSAEEVELTLFGSDEQQREEFGYVGAKTSIFADVPFSGLELLSAVDTTVEIIVTQLRVEAMDGAQFTVTLDPDQVPLSVETTRGDAPGNPFYVSGLTYSDTPAASLVDNAAVAVNDTADALLAANALRLEARFTNIGTSPVALGALGITWAKRSIILYPGDTWVETKGAALAWYGITDAGGSASVTVQELRA